MNKKIIYIIIGIVAILSISLFFYLNSNKETDAIKFSKEYTEVGEKNVFVYRSAKEIINILERGTGVVFLGFPECSWCQAYAPQLNAIARDLGIMKIFYCDIRKDRADNTEEYKKIVSLLGDNLLYDDEGNHRVYVPDVTIVKEGKILAHDNETSMAVEAVDGTPESYWTTERRDALRYKLEKMLEPLVDEACNSCE